MIGIHTIRHLLFSGSEDLEAGLLGCDAVEHTASICTSVLKMQTVCSSETLEPTYGVTIQTTKTTKDNIL